MHAMCCVNMNYFCHCIKVSVAWCEMYAITDLVIIFADTQDLSQ